MEVPMRNRISRLRRLAAKYDLILRKWRNQLSDDSWDLFDVHTGGAVFGGPANGYMGVSLDTVEAYLRTPD
jgi:hypothetical protein